MTTKKIRQSPKLPAETRRRQLLDAARKLFVKKGFRATTTEEIARKAGLTKGALYFHFKNKEDILFELVKSIAGKYDTAIEAGMPSQFRPDDFFKILLGVHTEVKLPDYWDTVDIWVQAIRIPRIKRFITRRLNEVLAKFQEKVDPAYGTGKKNTTELGVLTFALCDGLCILKMMDPSMVDVDAQVKLFGQFLESNRKMARTRNK
jgi:AcrR family transcriptional regulator